MTEIIIKEYTEEYRDEVIELILDIQQNEFDIPIKKSDQPDLCDIPNYYQVHNGNFWIALDKSRVVGTISLLDIGNKQGAMRKMFVNKSYRGSGYNTAARLLQCLIFWAHQKNIDEIFLGTTDKFLAAHRFYEKKGFVMIFPDDLPPAFPIMKVDTRFYKYVVM